MTDFPKEYVDLQKLLGPNSDAHLTGKHIVAPDYAYQGHPPSVVCRQRRIEQHDTLRRLCIPDERLRLRRVSKANIDRWKQQAASKGVASPGLIVRVLKADWGKAAQEVAQRNGCCPYVLNMANAILPGGAYELGYAAQEENMLRRTDIHFHLDIRHMDEQRVYYKQDMINLLNAKDGVVYVDNQAPRMCIKGPEDLQDTRPDKIGYDPLPEDQIFLFWEIRAAAVDHRPCPPEQPNPKPVDRVEIRRRIRAQMDTLFKKRADFIVLGAWGCGAFQTPAALVAQIYKEEIDLARSLPNCPFKEITFAIFFAGYGADNYPIFDKVMKGTEPSLQQEGGPPDDTAMAMTAPAQGHRPLARQPAPAQFPGNADPYITHQINTLGEYGVVWKYQTGSAPSNTWNDMHPEEARKLEVQLCRVVRDRVSECKSLWRPSTKVRVNMNYYVDLSNPQRVPESAGKDERGNLLGDYYHYLFEAHGVSPHRQQAVVWTKVMREDPAKSPPKTHKQNATKR